MSHYIHAILEDLMPIVQSVPDNLNQKALQLCGDGMVATRQNIMSARHTLETAVKTLMTGVVLCRHSWLRTISLQLDFRATIEDLLFNGLGLFQSTSDTTFQEIDKNIKTSCTLGVTPSHRQYKPRQPYSSLIDLTLRNLQIKIGNLVLPLLTASLSITDKSFSRLPRPRPKSIEARSLTPL